MSPTFVSASQGLLFEAILVILLVIGIGFFMVLYDLKSSGNLFEVQVTIDPEPVRDFIVDSFESLLPTN